MTFNCAKRHYEALLEAAEVYRLKMLYAKKHTLANAIRVDRQYVIARQAMNDALGRGHVVA